MTDVISPTRLECAKSSHLYYILEAGCHCEQITEKILNHFEKNILYIFSIYKKMVSHRVHINK